MSNGFRIDYGGGGGPEDAVTWLLEFLERDYEKKVSEADAWKGGMDTYAQAIGMASNSEDLDEWNSLIENAIVQGEKYSAVTGQPEYELLAKMIEKSFDKKTNKIQSFEYALQSQAELNDKPFLFNKDMFIGPDDEYVKDKDEKYVWAGEPLWENLQSEDGKKYIERNKNKIFYDDEDSYIKDRKIGFSEKLGDKAITFPPDVSFQEIQDFVTLYTDAYSRGWIPKEKTLASVFQNLATKYQRDANYLRDMGIVFDANGEISNIGQLGDIKETYIVGDTEYDVRDLARDMYKNQNIYNIFEYALTNQDRTEEGFEIYWNEISGKHMLRSKEQPNTPYLSIGEVQGIFNLRDLSEFKAYEKERKKELKNDLDYQNQLLRGVDSDITTLLKIKEDLKSKDIAKIAEDVATRELLTGNQALNAFLSGGVSVIDDIMLGKTSQKNIINGRKKDILLNAWSWGAHEEILPGEFELEAGGLGGVHKVFILPSESKITINKDNIGTYIKDESIMRKLSGKILDIRLGGDSDILISDLISSEDFNKLKDDYMGREDSYKRDNTFTEFFKTNYPLGQEIEVEEEVEEDDLGWLKNHKNLNDLDLLTKLEPVIGGAKSYVEINNILPDSIIKRVQDILQDEFSNVNFGKYYWGSLNHEWYETLMDDIKAGEAITNIPEDAFKEKIYEGEDTYDAYGAGWK